MAKTKKPGKGKSGNPAKRAEQEKAATALRKPCLHCGKHEASKGGLWCLICSGRARRAGADNKPSAAMIRDCAFGAARNLGIVDAEGNLLPEMAA